MHDIAPKPFARLRGWATLLADAGHWRAWCTLALLILMTILHQR